MGERTMIKREKNMMRWENEAIIKGRSKDRMKK